MRADTRILTSELDRAPEDWSIRIRLIESAARDGRLAEAKRLVRESPGSDPLPGELQSRIYKLLTVADSNNPAGDLPKADN
ncbi:hypothetical protein N9B73_02115 [Verrucomicrobiales bacterium]|jgi:hypothetical protein|nr:hypothetical protein [Verrucomicrobiales bacterium]